jgi:PAS domain S-box-containing protein
LAAGESPKRVLILDSFRHRQDVVSALRVELGRLWPEPIDFFEQSLEASRLLVPEQQQAMIEFLKIYLETSPPDLVVAVGAPAMDFFAGFREQRFNDIPFLVIGADPRRMRPELRAGRVTAVEVQLDPLGFVGDILRILPGTRNIYFLTGAAPIERYWKPAIQTELKPLEDRVDFHWLDELPLAEMLRQSTSLPPHSVVVHLHVIVDAAGFTIEHKQAMKSLRQASNSPIFGPYEGQFGAGIVGGRLMPDRSLGIRAAQVAVRVLRGDDPSLITMSPMKHLPPVFDWRELQRWGISESRLPAGSTVHYRLPSLWEAYRWQVLGIVCVVALQSLLIAGLFVQRRRRGRAEHALAENEHKLRLITDSLPVLIGYIDREQRYQFSNQAFHDWFGVAPDTVRGRTMWDVTGEQFYGRIRPFVERALAGEQVAFAADTVLEDGHRLSVDGIHVPDQNELGETRGFYSLVMDVTARNLAQQEAGRLQDELAHAGRVSLMGVLAATLAHELNQPLTAILSNAQAAQRFLKSSSPNLQEIAEILEDIALDDERASEVIRRIRDLVKKEPVDFRMLDLAELLPGVERLTHKNALLRNIQVSLEVAPDLPQVRGDRVQLQQVLLNLLLNAFDATENSKSECRAVTVGARREDAQVIVEVRDHGVGIPAEIYHRLFEPFQSSKKQGLGMGLSISKAIVERHGGDLWAENSPGGGATFYVSLPVAQDDSVARDDTEASIQGKRHVEPVSNRLRGG